MSSQLDEAVMTLQQGGVIAYPTEAVWGVGCDPYNSEAVAKLLQLKNRHVDKGLILVAANVDQLQDLYLDLPDDLQARLLEPRAQPTTWLIEDKLNIIPRHIKGQHSAVAIRISAHPLVQALCESFDGMIVSTSANPSGFSPALSLQQCQSYFDLQVGCYVEGELGANDKPSQIIDLSSAVVLRS
ncbi:L-threonylcarbamoyladenylate synthase [Gammaproteobacteria bacterium AS21]